MYFTSNNKNMKKQVFISVVFVVFVIFFSVNYKTETNNRTFMIYMNGSDLESENKVASKDLKEICKSNLSENTTVLIYTGGTKNWHNKDIDSERNQIFEVKNGRLKLLKSLGKKSMGSSETLSEFVDYSMNNRKSDENILIFWNHGGGAISGFGKDENFNNDTLVLSEIEIGIKKGLGKSGDKIDMVVFDACLMSSFETAYSLRNYCDYMVASEELVPGYGFDYKKIIDRSLHMDIKRLGKFFVDSFYKESERKGKDKIITMSLLDLKEIENLYNNFMERLSYVGGYYNFDSLKEKVSLGPVFGGRTKEEGFSNMVDFYSLSLSILGEKDIGAIKEDLNDVVVYTRNGYLNREACGLSIFFPLNYNDKTLYELNLYNYISMNSNYYKFLESYKYFERNKKHEDIYKVKNVKNKNIIYEIIKDKKEDKKNNRIFYLNGNILSVYKIASVNNLDIYTAPIILNGKEASLRFCVNKLKGNTQIIGTVSARGKLNISEEKILDLHENDILKIINYEIMDDGEIKRVLSDEIKVTGETSVLQM